MARICLKCGKNIPLTIKVNGRRHNLKNRIYCFDCSPFKSHNTRKLHESPKETRAWQPRQCEICGQIFRSERGRKCFTCCFNKRLKTTENTVYNIVGESCWFCGYNKGVLGRKILCFHHIYPEDKKFGLNRRELIRNSWDLVTKEMRKCVLLCCRCHSECHAGIISEDVIHNLYIKKWTEIQHLLK